MYAYLLRSFGWLFSPKQLVFETGLQLSIGALTADCSDAGNLATSQPLTHNLFTILNNTNVTVRFWEKEIGNFFFFNEGTVGWFFVLFFFLDKLLDKC